MFTRFRVVIYSYILFLILVFFGYLLDANSYEVDNQIDPFTQSMLTALSDTVGCAYLITSGYRDSETNKLVGGSDKSFHKSGEAFDIVFNNTCIVPDAVIYEIAKVLFTGVIKYKTHWHLDTGNRGYYEYR